MKVILHYDPEDEELIGFMWDEPRKPPPIIKPRIKKKGNDNAEETGRPGPQ